MLVKSISAGFKDLDVKSGIVTGYFANFGSIDSDGDRIVKGAFAKTIKENGPEGTQLIKHLLDHNKNIAVGKLQQLSEDEVGLYYESKAGRHTNGRDFLLMAEDGIINQHSFGFRIIKEQKRQDANEISEVAMYEGSSIQFLGANRNTPVTGIKSESDILEDLGLLERAMRNGKYSDEAFVQIEGKIKSLYAILKPGITLAVIEPIKSDLLLNHIKNSFHYGN
jgi:HK97 family phage prohead protease